MFFWFSHKYLLVSLKIPRRFHASPAARLAAPPRQRVASRRVDESDKDDDQVSLREQLFGDHPNYKAKAKVNNKQKVRDLY